jgi:fructoselysine-6-P-deglycase FrlB-like protein
MNSIEALKVDFHAQLRELDNISNRKIFDECIYVGSGDSYAAGLIAEYLTDHRCRCYSPSDLFNSKFVYDKTYCFISVTGKTRANIEVARRASRAGVKTIAVTLDKSSRLANICNDVVPLKITRTDTPTSGFGTFVANVVTCLQLSGIKLPRKFSVWHKKGVQLSKNLLSSVTIPEQTLYLFGNNTLYAIALYASLQMAEFFGSTAFAHKLEEFCHSPIFGLKKSDYVWILGQNEEQIRRRLNRLGHHLSYIELYNKDIFAQLFASIFFVQNLILLLAEKYGYTELQYVKMKDVLSASSDIIYGKIN